MEQQKDTLLQLIHKFRSSSFSHRLIHAQLEMVSDVSPLWEVLYFIAAKMFWKPIIPSCLCSATLVKWL